MKRNIATIVAGVILSTGLITGNIANANHESCEIVAKKAVELMKSKDFKDTYVTEELI